jgi:hypothetical protein
MCFLLHIKSLITPVNDCVAAFGMRNAGMSKVNKTAGMMIILSALVSP